MATKTQQRISKKRGKFLKRAGLIDFDLRSNLTPSQRGTITRLWEGPRHAETGGRSVGWRNFLDPKKKDDIVFRTLSKKRIKQFDDLGYRTTQKRVYLDREESDSIHIVRDTVVRKKGRKTTTDFLITDEDLLDEIKLRVNKKQKKGEFFTVRIGDFGPFRKRFVSIAGLEQYLRRWTPRKEKNRREELISMMSIVKFQQ